MHVSIAHLGYMLLPSFSRLNKQINRASTLQWIPPQNISWVAHPKPWVPLFPSGVNPKEIPFTTKDLARKMGRRTTGGGRKKRTMEKVSKVWGGKENLRVNREEESRAEAHSVCVDSATCWKIHPQTRNKPG